MKKLILIAILLFLLWAACVIGVAYGLRFSGTRFALFCSLVILLGAVAIVVACWYIARTRSAHAGAELSSLDGVLSEASRKLRSGRGGARSLASSPVLYILGESGSGKTETIIQSGLDAELLAGNVYRDGMVVPTELANVWLAGSWVIVEPGAAVQRNSALWRRLIKATQPGSFGSLFSRSARQPMRAAVICTSLRPPGTVNTDQTRLLARELNDRLRQLSRSLGSSLPVYVLFTRLDSQPHFADYAALLSSDEIKLPLGEVLDPIEGGSGLFAERAAALLAGTLDRIVFQLSGFRLDLLGRGGAPAQLASAYEFPRDLNKQRNHLVDSLVETTRPGQLGANPLLRGCFFSGIRLQRVERSRSQSRGTPGPQPASSSATVVFDMSSLARTPLEQPPTSSSVATEPQTVFLPHLFSQIVLNDTPALDASRSSTRVQLLKRTLLATVSVCLFAYLLLLTVSFFNNRDLEQQVTALAGVAVTPATPTQFASARDLQVLDHLGAILLTLHQYRREGPPLKYRWALYSGNSVLPPACNAYASKFRTLLLGPTQGNMLAQLRGLQSPPSPDADYNAGYTPLKAYLVTTSNPEKSGDFLPRALTTAWEGPASPPSDVAGLAQKQFQTYATLLLEPQPCLASIGGQPDLPTRDHAREYLSHFGGFQHVYQSILADAGHRFHSIRYNDTFPGSARFLVDNYQVHGAFTKNAFLFMQNAIQHPEPYFSGEEWVLGPASSSSVDPATLPSLLRKQYIADYLAAWRAYIKAAQFTGYQNLKDAGAKLKDLDSNTSPILEFFYLVSANTSVSMPEIANAFQPPQAVVPPGGPDNRFLSPANQPYVQALQGLEQAIDAFNLNPASASDPNAAAPILQAAGAAHQATESLRNAFTQDPVGKIDTVSFDRLEDPIRNAQSLAHSSVDPSGGAGQNFCNAVGPVLAKFPFNPQANAEASPQEVAQIFAPGQSDLATLHGKTSQFVTFQGGRYAPVPGTNPAWVAFVNAADRVSTMLFSRGTQPTLTVSLHQVKVTGEPDATLNIDGQQLNPGQTASFHWTSQPSSHILVSAGGENSPSINGPWAIFHLALDGTHIPPNAFDVTFSFNRRVTQTVRLQAEGPGADMLRPAFLRQLHCVSRVTKQ